MTFLMMFFVIQVIRCCELAVYSRVPCFNDNITDVLCTLATGDCTCLLCFHAGTFELLLLHFLVICAQLYL